MTKLSREKKCDEKIILIIFDLIKIMCVIIKFDSFCFLCVSSILSSIFTFFSKLKVSIKLFYLQVIEFYEVFRIIFKKILFSCLIFLIYSKSTLYSSIIFSYYT